MTARDLKKLIAAIVDEEIAVNVRPRYPGFMQGVYLVGIKRATAVSAKRTVKLLRELGLICAALLILTAASAPRLYACLKPDGDWLHGVSKKECKQLRGRWLPQGDDMPMGTRA